MDEDITLKSRNKNRAVVHLYGEGNRALPYEERSVNGPCVIQRDCIKKVLLGRKSRPTTARNDHLIRSGYAPEVISEGLEREDKEVRTMWKRRTDQFLQLQWGVLSSMEEYVWVEYRLPAYLQRCINI